MKYSKILSNTVIITIALLAMACASKESVDIPGANPEPNPPTDNAENAPDFSLTDLNGNTVKLDDFNNKVLVLFFSETTVQPASQQDLKFSLNSPTPMAQITILPS